MLLKKRLAYCGGLSTLLLSLNVSAGGDQLQMKQEQCSQEAVFTPNNCSTIGNNAVKITGVVARHIKTTGVINDFTVKFQVRYTAEMSKRLPTPEPRLINVPVCGKTEGMLHCAPLELSAIVDTNRLYQKGDQLQIVQQGCEKSDLVTHLTDEGAQVVEIVKTYKEDNELILEFQFTRSRIGDSETQEYVGEAARQIFNMHLDRINSSVGTTSLLGDIWSLCNYNGDLSSEEVWGCTKQVGRLVEKNANISCQSNQAPVMIGKDAGQSQVACDQSAPLVSKGEVPVVKEKGHRSHRSDKSTSSSKLNK